MEYQISTIQSTDDAHPQSRFWLNGRRVKKIGVIFFALVLFAYIGLHVGARVFYNNLWEKAHQHKPTFYDQIQEFWNTPILFPKEWDRDYPVSVKFDQKINDLKRTFDDINKKEHFFLENDIIQWGKKIQNGVPSLNREDWKELDVFIQILKPYLNEGLELIEAMELERRKTPPSEPLIDFTEKNYILERLQSLLKLQAIQLNHAGYFNEAFLQQLSTLSLFIKNPHSQLFYYYTKRNSDICPFLITLQSLSENVWEPETLEKGLQILNRWEPYLFQIKKEYAHLYSLFSKLKKYEIPIEFDKAIKAKVYCLEINDREMPMLGIPKTVSILFDHWVMGKSIGHYDMEKLAVELIRPLLLTRDIEDLCLWHTALENGDTTLFSERRAATMYDQLRIFIAARLYLLENHKYPTSMADLVPQYFPTEIKNRNTDEPYRWDDQGRLILDPPSPTAK